MKVQEIVSTVDNLKPNKFDLSFKLEKLSDIEGLIIEEVINKHENEAGTVEFKEFGPEDIEKELCVDSKFRDVYIFYIMAQIDYMYAEFERYNNDIAKFNEAYSRFAKWYNRTHMPFQTKIRGI